MKKPLPIFLHRLYFLPALVFLVFTVNIVAANNTSPYKHETDSLKQLVDTCSTDTKKFKILSNFFWKNIGEIDRVKHVGNWAFEVIKGSDDKGSLSYGLMIKGVILKSERENTIRPQLFLKMPCIWPKPITIKS